MISVWRVVGVRTHTAAVIHFLQEIKASVKNFNFTPRQMIRIVLVVLVVQVALVRFGYASYSRDANVTNKNSWMGLGQAVELVNDDDIVAGGNGELNPPVKTKTSSAPMAQPTMAPTTYADDIADDTTSITPTAQPTMAPTSSADENVDDTPSSSGTPTAQPTMVPTTYEDIIYDDDGTPGDKSGEEGEEEANDDSKRKRYSKSSETPVWLKKIVLFFYSDGGIFLGSCLVLLIGSLVVTSRRRVASATTSNGTEKPAAKSSRDSLFSKYRYGGRQLSTVEEGKEEESVENDIEEELGRHDPGGQGSGAIASAWSTSGSASIDEVKTAAPAEMIICHYPSSATMMLSSEQSSSNDTDEEDNCQYDDYDNDFEYGPISSGRVPLPIAAAGGGRDSPHAEELPLRISIPPRYALNWKMLDHTATSHRRPPVPAISSLPSDSNENQHISYISGHTTAVALQGDIGRRTPSADRSYYHPRYHSIPTSGTMAIQPSQQPLTSTSYAHMYIQTHTNHAQAAAGPPVHHHHAASNSFSSSLGCGSATTGPTTTCTQSSILSPTSPALPTPNSDSSNDEGGFNPTIGSSSTTPNLLRSIVYPPPQVPRVRESEAAVGITPDTTSTVTVPHCGAYVDEQMASMMVVEDADDPHGGAVDGDAMSQLHLPFSTGDDEQEDGMSTATSTSTPVESSVTDSYCILDSSPSSSGIMETQTPSTSTPSTSTGDTPGVAGGTTLEELTSPGVVGGTTLEVLTSSLSRNQTSVLLMMDVIDIDSPHSTDSI